MQEAVKFGIHTVIKTDGLNFSGETTKEQFNAAQEEISRGNTGLARQILEGRNTSRVNLRIEEQGILAGESGEGKTEVNIISRRDNAATTHSLHAEAHSSGKGRASVQTIQGTVGVDNLSLTYAKEQANLSPPSPIAHGLKVVAALLVGNRFAQETTGNSRVYPSRAVSCTRQIAKIIDSGRNKTINNLSGSAKRQAKNAGFSEVSIKHGTPGTVGRHEEEFNGYDAFGYHYETFEPQNQGPLATGVMQTRPGVKPSLIQASEHFGASIGEAAYQISRQDGITYEIGGKYVTLAEYDTHANR